MPTEIRTPTVGDLVVFNHLEVCGATVDYIGCAVTVTEVSCYRSSDARGSLRWTVYTDSPDRPGRTTWGFECSQFEDGYLTLLPAGSIIPPKPPLRGRPSVKPLPLP